MVSLAQRHKGKLSRDLLVLRSAWARECKLEGLRSGDGGALAKLTKANGRSKPELVITKLEWPGDRSLAGNWRGSLDIVQDRKPEQALERVGGHDPYSPLHST